MQLPWKFSIVSRVAAEKRLPQDKDGPFAKRRVCVVGRGPLGIFAALALAQNGAVVTMVGPEPTGSGVGFENAAGLIEPVATEDPRAAMWMREMVEFCRWAESDDSWGMIRRRVLFMSDDPLTVNSDWISEMDSTPASEGDLRGVRGHGAWFETYVIQPDLALKAIRRELRSFGMEKSWSGEAVSRDLAFDWVDEVARIAANKFGAEFFVLAPGISLGKFGDIADLLGPAAGFSAGMGLTIEMPADAFTPRLEHVVMDFDALGYLIPQKTRVVAGGTNEIATHDDPIVASGGHPMLNTEWEADVRDKIERLAPGAGSLPGRVKVGARPMRKEVLTHYTGDFEIPGLILGGAGGSGWTFAVGIAHVASRVIQARMGCPGALAALGSGQPLPGSAPVAPEPA